VLDASPARQPMIAASGTISTSYQDDLCENELLAKIRDESFVKRRRRVPGRRQQRIAMLCHPSILAKRIHLQKCR